MENKYIMENLFAKSIYFRLVNEEDAEFICSVRNDPSLNTHLSKSTNKVSAQKEWIKEYKIREQYNQEFYFIICRKKDNLPVGTVRLYDFRENPKSFCWGSWILNTNKTPYAAIESALLVYEFGFQHLKFDQSHFDVRKENDKVNSFHRKMGALEIGEDKENIYYAFNKQQHEYNKKYRYGRFIEGSRTVNLNF
jgi:butyryltransferase